MPFWCFLDLKNRRLENGRDLIPYFPPPKMTSGFPLSTSDKGTLLVTGNYFGPLIVSLKREMEGRSKTVQRDHGDGSSFIYRRKNYIGYDQSEDLVSRLTIETFLVVLDYTYLSILYRPCVIMGYVLLILIINIMKIQ